MRSAVLLVLVFSCCVDDLFGSPAARRVRRQATALPAGIPLDLLFSACGGQVQSDDIGPCVEELLSGAIDLAKPSFSTGVRIDGKNKILEPLSLKDIKEKPKKKFRFSASQLKVHGLSTVSVDDVSLRPDSLALQLSFTQLRATSSLHLRYRFITASPDVELRLNQPSIRIQAGWSLTQQDDNLVIQLNNPSVDIEIASFGTTISRLPGLGGFIQSILNNNNQLLLDFFLPDLERQAAEKLGTELSTIKLA